MTGPRPHDGAGPAPADGAAGTVRADDAGTVRADDAAVAALADLVAVMDRLRSPGGCPWDAEQTHASLLPYAVEEVFEVVEAVETGDREALREELGDLLLQVVFHARVAAEDPDEPFGIGDVAAGIAAKLRRRHPHVFGDVEVSGAQEVHANWERIKKAEKARESALDGVPAGLPALARAEKVAGRASRAGLPVAEIAASLAAAPVAGSAETRARPGVADAGVAGAAPDAPGDRPDEASRVVGLALLSIALEAQADGIDAEAALRGVVRELEAALRATESRPA